MTESDETQQDIKEIKWHIEKVDNKMDLLIRGNSEALNEIAEVFQGDPAIAQVYLAIDGKRTQQEIVEEVDYSQPTVSRRVNKLKRDGLIQKKEWDNGVVWERDDTYSLFRLDEKVDPETGWNDD